MSVMMLRAKVIMQLCLIGVMACGLSACGNKGKLKSPSQAAASEAKKERKKIKLDAESSEKEKAAESSTESSSESQAQPPAETQMTSPEAQ
jgi:predicted small lipoprotein YifL